MPQNKNNFLRWDGSDTPLSPAWALSSALSVFFYANDDSIICQPLTGITNSTTGIDPTSFQIIAIQNIVSGSPVALTLSTPPSWDGASNLTLYRPLTYASTMFVVFTVNDLLGNTSPQFQVEVNFSAVYTEWVPYPVSTVCLLDSFGNNTGYQSWNQLELVNMATGTPISPLTLKDNVQGDPDYYPPVQNYSLCPPPGAGTGNYIPLIISNYSKNPADTSNFITIYNIYLSSSNMGPGGTPFVQNIPCSVPPGQSVRFMIPAPSAGYLYDGGISISYNVTGNMITGSAASYPRYWTQNNAGVLTGFPTGGTTTNIVDNSGIISGASFNPPSSQGVVIIAQ
jgi:hypothetical protein